MKRNLFTTVFMLLTTVGMISAIGIISVSAQYPTPEIVIRPQLVTGTTDPTTPPYGYATYYVNIKNAPHHDLEGVTPDTYSKTWSWQMEVNWNASVLGDPYIMEDTYTASPTAGILGYFSYYEFVPVPFPHYEQKYYPRSGLTTSPAPYNGKVVIFDGLKAAPDPTTIPIYAGDPNAGLHLGSNYDLPYSAGIDISAGNPMMYGANELNLCILSFPILKNGPANATRISINVDNTYFWAHDAKTTYHVSRQDAWFGVIGPHLHHVGSPIPDPASPVTTSWHELFPNYCNEYDLTDWNDDNGDGILSYCDSIELTPTSPVGTPMWYHVEVVTTTITVSLKPDLLETMYIDYELPADTLPGEVYEPISEPVSTQWHELYPDYCQRYHLTDWDDNGDGELSPSDQIYLTDKETGEGAWYHVDDVSTDIIVTPTPGVPEFPLGTGLLMMIALAIPIVYLWRTRKKEM